MPPVSFYRYVRRPRARAASDAARRLARGSLFACAHIGLMPSMDTLPSLVDEALGAVRLYMYRPPSCNGSSCTAMDEPLTFRLDDSITSAWLDVQRIAWHSVRTKLNQKKHPWVDLETSFWSQLPARVWTNNPENATFFVIPHATLLHRVAWDTLSSTRAYVSRLARLMDFIHFALPYYNRSGGRDHAIVWGAENGPFCDCHLRTVMAAQEPVAWTMLDTVVRIGYFGHRNTSMFRWHLDRDIAVPQWGAVHPLRATNLSTALQDGMRAYRRSYGFSGSFWGGEASCAAVSSAAGVQLSVHTCSCSPGVRLWLKDYMKTSCNSTNSTRCRADARQNRMGDFWFALCPAAWACWSSRLYDAIDSLVVPVIMADGHVQPFESLLDWKSFSVTLDTVALRAPGGTQGLDGLHDEAVATAMHCSACPSCLSCTRIGLVQRMMELERVRSWLRYNSSSVYSVSGLVLVELHCRQLWLAGLTEGVPCVRLGTGRVVLEG